MNTSKIIDYFRAGFSCIWIKTNEHERIKREIYPLIKEYETITFENIEWNLISNKEPMEGFQRLNDAKENTILFAENFHWFIDKPPVIQAIKNFIPLWEHLGKHFVVVSNTVKIPSELEKDFIILEHPFPSDEIIKDTLQHVIPDKKFEPSPKEKEIILKASKGLTRRELENVFALSLVQEKKIDSSVINAFKEQAINKTGFLRVLRSQKTFNDILGYEKVKNHVLATYENPEAKGFIMIGPPGTGKTSIAEAIANETKKFGLIVDMGKLFSKFVGETDKNVDFIINLISSIGNCFVLIDEFEKSFAGVGGGGENDGGTTKRALSRWLDFLQNRPRGIYIVATANSVKGIPAEYLRPGRWDCSPFAMDLPSEETAQKMVQHYCKAFKVKPSKVDVKDFSGAEIEALVKMASMRKSNLNDMKEYIIPVARSMKDQLQDLRKWCNENCVAADVSIKKEMKRRLTI